MPEDIEVVPQKEGSDDATSIHEKRDYSQEDIESKRVDAVLKSNEPLRKQLEKNLVQELSKKVYPLTGSGLYLLPVSKWFDSVAREEAYKKMSERGRRQDEINAALAKLEIDNRLAVVTGMTEDGQLRFCIDTSLLETVNFKSPVEAFKVRLLKALDKYRGTMIQVSSTMNVSYLASFTTQAELEKFIQEFK